MTKGRLLCAVGLHKWEAETYQENNELVTRNRCERPECPRYKRWFFVNAEPMNRWRPW
jgi:hypothetical protein